MILRGVNVSGDAKVPPFLPNLKTADFDRLESLGMNVVRLLMIWEAYEPSPGLYNEAYLAGLRAIARAAWSRGMYVIIDIHQDGFSRYTSRGSGDGFPAWAVSPRGALSRPHNGPSCKAWPLLMVSDRTTHRSFDDFFSDATGTRSRYLAMLGRVAATFSGVPGVIGYDLMNEPWGNEHRDLAPLYRDAALVVRAPIPRRFCSSKARSPQTAAFSRDCLDPILTVRSMPRITITPDDRVQRLARHDLRHAPGLVANGVQGKGVECPAFCGRVWSGGNGPPGRRLCGGHLRLSRRQPRLGHPVELHPGSTPGRKDGWNGEDLAMLTPDGRPRPNFRPRPYPRYTAGEPHCFRYTRSLVTLWSSYGTTISSVATRRSSYPGMNFQPVP